MSVLKASCHCGAVELHLTPAEPIENAARCDCSFCRRRQAANISVKVPDLRVIGGAEALTLYQWGTGTAKHYFCKICGIYTHHQRRSDTGEFGVNVGCIEGVNPADLGRIPWNDGVNHPSDSNET
jgi:hypothetical protein